MEVNDIIPLGSVVELKNFKDYIMLVGIEQIKKVIIKGCFDDEVKDFYEDTIWKRQNEEGK